MKRFSLMDLKPIRNLLDARNSIIEQNNELLMKQIKFKEEISETRKNMVQRIEQLRAQKLAMIKEKNLEIRANNQSFSALCATVTSQPSTAHVSLAQFPKVSVSTESTDL